MPDPTSTPATTGRCALTGAAMSTADLVHLEVLSPNLAARIRADHPGIAPDAAISATELAKYRMKYVQEMLATEQGEFTELEHQVAASIAQNETIARNVDEEMREARTLGERLSDHLATFGGSWLFLILFAVVLLVWIAGNVAAGNVRAFDPYPFILLNLVLSCLAAIQAPIIMMSQKRQEAKDRGRAVNDYRVNLKAELEIRHLHEKLDHLILKQWQRLAEIQQMQLEIMQESKLKGT